MHSDFWHLPPLAANHNNESENALPDAASAMEWHVGVRGARCGSKRIAAVAFPTTNSAVADRTAETSTSADADEIADPAFRDC